MDLRNTHPVRCASILVSTIALLLPGCADLAPPQDCHSAPVPPRNAALGEAQRERVLTQAWSGKTRADLEREWGPPWQVLRVPGCEQPPSTVVLVFKSDDPRVRCVDAFVVQTDEKQTILSYVCR